MLSSGGEVGARLIQHVAGVDALVDEMHGDAGVGRIAVAARPVGAVLAAILGIDAGVVVDEGCATAPSVSRLRMRVP